MSRKSKKRTSVITELLSFVEKTLSRRNAHNPFKEMPMVEPVTDRRLGDSLILKTAKWQAICSSKSDVKRSLKRLRELQNAPRRS